MANGRQILTFESIVDGLAAGNRLRGFPACLLARQAENRPEFRLRVENCHVVTRLAKKCPGVSRACPGSFGITETREALRRMVFGDLSRLSRSVYRGSGCLFIVLQQ